MYSKANNSHIAAALFSDAIYTYEFDVTTGIVEQEIIAADGINYTKKMGLSVPYHFDECIKASILQTMEVTYASPVDRNETITQALLLSAFEGGHRKIENVIHYAAKDKYLKVTYYLWQSAEDGHIWACAACEDISAGWMRSKIAVMEAQKAALEGEINAFRNVHDSIGSGEWRVDFAEDGSVSRSDWSVTYRKLLGFAPDAPYGTTLEAWSDRIHPEDRDFVLKEFWDAVHDLSGEKTYDAEYRILKEDNTYGWFRGAGRVTRRPDGTPVFCNGIFINKDEKHSAFEKIRLALGEADMAKNLMKQESATIAAISCMFFAIYRVDVNTGIYEEVACQAALHDMTGIRGESRSAIKPVIDALVAPEYREKCTEFVDYTTLAERLSDANTIEYEYLASGGKWHEVRFMTETRDDNGVLTSALFTVRVLSREKQIALENERDRLKKLNSDMQNRMNMIDGLTKAIVAAYQADLRTGEYIPAKVSSFSRRFSSDSNDIRNSFARYIPCGVQPEDRDSMRAFTDIDTLAERLRTCDVIDMDFHSTVPEREWCRAGWVATRRDDDGRAVCALFVVEDVTESVNRRNAQIAAEKEEYKLEQLRMQTIMEAIHGGFKVGRNDREFSFITISKQLAEMLGYASPEEMMKASGGTMAGIVNRADTARELPGAIRCIAEGKMYTMRYRMRCKDGTWKNVEDRGRLFRKPNGEQEYWSFITDQDDLTKKTEALAAAEQANAALEQAQKELQIARDAAETASKAKTSFLFNMSHDIRTPMNAILGYSRLMEKELTDPRLLHYQQKMAQASEFLLSLINNVLDMARIESGKAEVDNEPACPDEIVGEIFSVFEASAREKGLDFSYRADVSAPCLLADTLKVKEIYTNLISNSIKYTPAGGTVKISIRELPCAKEGFVNIESVFEDTGIGMSREYLEHIFEEFTREQNTTQSKVTGTGLGMAIVKRLVDLLGGTIRVESELGKGTRITVVLPHEIADARYTGSREALHTAAKAGSGSLSGKKILLAEDNELNAEIAVALLEEMGFAVETVADGILCVDAVSHHPAGTYDLILMDIQMPNMDGYKAAHAIRRMPDAEKANIPIIAMTANAFEEDKKNAFAAGMNAHVAKPIDTTILMKTLTEILNAAQEQQPGSL